MPCFHAKRRGIARRTLAGVLLSFFLFGLLGVPGVQPATAQAPTPAAGTSAPAVARMTSTTIHTGTLPEAVQSIDLQPGRISYPGCLDHPEIPAVDYATDNLTLTDIAFIATCGWQPDETVTVTLMDPRGRITTSTVKAVPSKHMQDVYEADVFYQPGMDAVEGKYRFTLQGSAVRAEGGTLKAKLTFTRPAGARLYAQAVAAGGGTFQPLRGATGGQQQLRLTGFLPGEPVRLLAYRFSGTIANFYGWQDFTTDPRGQLIVETDLSEIGKDVEIGYFAYARETHFVPLERFTWEGYSITRRFEMDLYCPGAQPLHLKGGEGWQGGDVIYAAAGLTKVEVRKQPGYGSQLAASVPGDTEMTVYGQPKCIDHAYWWKVSLKKPILFGWVAETYLGKYQVEAVEVVQ